MILLYYLIFLLHVFTSLQSLSSNLQKKESLFSFSDYKIPFKFICGKIAIFPKEKIVGGKEVQSIEEIPWQARILAQDLQKSLTFLCGGSLIGDNVILSAAHCFKFKDVTQYQVHLGSENAEISSCFSQLFSIIKIEIHPNFERDSLKNDIALVWITSSPYGQNVFFNKRVLPVCLPEPKEDTSLYYKSGTMGTVSGWGLLGESENTTSEVLMYTQIPLISDEKCRHLYKNITNIDSKIQFCAGENQSGKDACSGDSGGPFFISVKERSYLTGIVSFGKGCARSEFPGVYTRVQSFLPWIYKHIGTLSSSSQFESSSVKIPTNNNNIFTKVPETLMATTTISTNSKISTISQISNLFISSTLKITTKSTVILENSSNVIKIIPPICKGEYRILICPDGLQINLVNVFYGNNNNTICNETLLNRGASTLMSCELKNAISFLHNSCSFRHRCWVYPSLFTSDPCPFVKKYITIEYTCI